MTDAFIIAMTRSAFTKAKKGGLRFTRSDDLGVEIIGSLLKQVPELSPNKVDDVIVGCANPEGEQGLQIGRQIALRALGESVPGMTVNRYCASGLESLAIATAKIRSGMASCLIAGGVESMSLVPMEGYKLAPSYQLAFKQPDYLVGMGLTAEAVARKYEISREDQDAFALQSHVKAAKAQEMGLFKQEICPVKLREIKFEEGKRTETEFWVSEDDGIRKDTSVEALAILKPAFASDGTVTAGNSSQTSDGVCFHILVSEQQLNVLKIEPVGRIVSCAVAGVDPLFMGMGPCAAIPLALRQAGLKLNDISWIELNEAFAAQTLAVMRQADLDPDITNMHGGAIALGHPLGCSGARLTMTALLVLRRRQQKYGLITACVGGGQGIAAVVEAM